MNIKKVIKVNVYSSLRTGHKELISSFLKVFTREDLHYEANDVIDIGLDTLDYPLLIDHKYNSSGALSIDMAALDEDSQADEVIDYVSDKLRHGYSFEKAKSRIYKERDLRFLDITTEVFELVEED